MSYLEWNSDFETGIPGIDYEHRALVSMLNDIHSLIATGADAEKIGGTLCDFHALATAHFALEEKLMQDEQYAGLAERRNIHHQLLDEVSEIVDACDAGDYALYESLSATLKEWLLQAIIGDVELLAAIGEQGLRRRGLERT
jgi:hemerythrin-like metal-binding protein